MATRFLTEAELRADYGSDVITRLADRNRDGSADSGVVEDAILDAEDEALGYLRGRYTDAELPTTPETTARRLKALVSHIAYYNLHKHLAQRPFTVRDERDNAIKELERIRDGKVSILLADSPAVDSGRAIVSVSKRSSSLDEDRITLANMRDWGHRP